MKCSLFKILMMGLVVAGAASVAAAQTASLSARESDPVTMGWMQGSPVPNNRIIRFSDGSHLNFPQTRWAFSHFREFVPTRNISRGSGAPSQLKIKMRRGIDNVSFTPMGSDTPMSWAESLFANYTDSILVMHKGRVVYERYFGAAAPEKPHISFSMTKSYFGILAAILIEEGRLDPAQVVVHYIPELEGSAFADATVRQLLDMTTGIDYSEVYSDPNSEVWQFAYSGGVRPAPTNYTGPKTFHEFLRSLQKEGAHGATFSYESVNTEVIGWLVQRITQARPEKMLSERIWQKLGAEHDAYIMLDSEGTSFTAGGMSATLRDHARFGEMLRRGGTFNGKRIVSKAIVEDIQRGGDRHKFEKAGYKTLPNWSYRSKWWVSHDSHGAYAARGVYGQTIYIDPKADMVIVRLASNPVAANAAIDPTSLPAYRAVAEFLMGK